MRDLLTGRAHLTDTDLAELYTPGLDAVSLGSARTRGVWVRTNLVTSLDGSVTGPDGVSGSLGSDADTAVFGLLRALCDVVLVGAATARQEGYQPLVVDPRWAGLRSQAGLAGEAPVLAVLTRSGDLGSSLAPGGHPASGVMAVDATDGLDGAIEQLREAGNRVVLCEGGPSVWQQALEDDLVDEWCQTLAPTHIGGAMGSVRQELSQSARWELAGLLEEDSALLSRWRRQARG